MSREIKFRAWSKSNKTMEYDTGHRVDCDLYELMQFTGLHDKNGKEIYEGDIVTYPAVILEPFDEGAKDILKVEYDQIGFKIGEEYLYDTHEDCEIIGNIYENPELCQPLVPVHQE